MPATPTMEEQIKDIAQNFTSMKDAQNEILAHFAEGGRLEEAEKAVKQLEEQYKTINASVQQKLARIRRTSWDERGNYRGVFGSEDEARAFGLYCMAKARGWDAQFRTVADRAEQALKREFPDIHEREFGAGGGAGSDAGGGGEKRAMDSTSDGAIITPEFSSRLISLFERYGVFEKNAFIMPMGSDSLSFPRQTGEMEVFLVGEGQAGSESEPTFGNVTLNAREWGTLTYIPRTLEEDAAVAIGELIAQEIGRAMAKKMDRIGFNGDGTAPYFGIVGVRERLKGLSGTIGNIAGLVVGSGNLWSELAKEDHEEVMGTLPEYAADGAQWYASRKYFFTVMVRIMLSEGGVTAGEIEGKRKLMFMGAPVELTQAMPRDQANSQVAALFGDLRSAATVGRRREVTIETSRDYKFAERQITYLGTRRVAINVHDVGNASATEADRVAGPIVGLITAAG